MDKIFLFKWKKNILIFLFLLTISLWSVWPVVVNLGKGITSYGDSLLITWIVNQNIQKIPLNLAHFFQGNIFYPFKDVIAYSEIFLPASVVAYLPVVLTRLPVVAFNFNIIFEQIALVFIIYFWFKEITKDNLSSLVGTIVLALSQIRLFFQSYLQMWSVMWWLLSLFMLWKYKKYLKQKYLVLAAIFAGIQFWQSLLPVFFILFAGTLILLTNFKNVFRNSKNFVLPAIIFLSISLPLAIKYFQVSQEFGITRSIREAARFSANLNDLWGILFSPALILLLVLSFILAKKKIINKVLKKGNDFYWLAGIAVTGLIMSLGPVLKFNDSTFKIVGKIFIPLPYGIFYYIIPGFNGLRTPMRWIFLFAFGISGIIALVFSKLKHKHRNLVLILCLCIAIFGGSRVKNIHKVPKPNEYPSVYKFIKNESGNVIIEMPMYSWGIGEPFQHEFWRMFYSLEHKKTLINGTSGFNPPEWEKLQSYLWGNFPGDNSESYLRKIGTNYIFVHKDEYDPIKLELITKWGQDKLIWEDPQTLVYSLN
jgi:hypothetical protein